MTTGDGYSTSFTAADLADAAARQLADVLPVETWAEFRDRAPANVEWIIRDVVAAGHKDFIAGRPKAGKTWLGTHMAVSVATGRPFLGRFVVEQPAPVLYLALEGHAAAVRARIGCLLRGAGVDPDSDVPNLHIRHRAAGIDLQDAVWASRLIRTADDLEARLVMVDVLRKAAPRLRESGDGAGDFAQLVANLDLLTEMGVAIVFLHHFIKRSGDTSDRGIGELMSGSGALFGHADAILGITHSERVRGVISRLRVESEMRDAASLDTLGVEFHGAGTGEHGGLVYRDTLRLIAGGSAPSSQHKVAPAEISQWIAEQPGSVATSGSIATRFNIDEKTVRNYRDELGTLGVEYVSAGNKSHYRHLQRNPGIPGSEVGPDVLRRNPEPPYRGSGVPSASSRDLDQPSLDDELPPLDELDFDDQAAGDD